MIRSPAIPPLSPALPLPLIFSCIPSCTPAGMSIVTVSSPYTRPSPLQVLHFAVIVEPSPLQLGQVLTVCICPRKVFCTLLTCPLPPHVLQVCTLPSSFAPFPPHVLQATCFFTLIFFVTPFAISSYESFNLMRRLLPLIPRFRWPPRLRWPPPNMFPKRSSPKISPNWLKISSMFIPPPYPPLPFPLTPACP